MTITQDTRKKLADKDQAMPDGSFPIRNATDLGNAIKTFGLSKDKVKAKAWIIKRAKELDLTSTLPSGWVASNKTMSHASLIAKGENYLSHFGVLGMKWGQRNADSQREEGSSPRRVQFRDTETGKTTVRKYPVTASSDHVTAKELAKKPTHSLSNSELQKLNTRLQLETQYSKLKSNTNSLSKIKKGNSTVKTVIEVVGTAGAAIALIKSPAGQKAVATGARVIGKLIGKW